MILWSCLSIALFKAHESFFGTLPLSHLGLEDASKYWFSAGLIIAAILTISFLYYLNDVFTIRRAFIISAVIGQIGQVIVALAPDAGRWQTVHTTAAFVLAFSIPILMWIFASSLRVSDLKKVILRLFVLEVVLFIIGIGCFVTINKAVPLSQALPAIGFHIWLIVITFNKAVHAYSNKSS